MIETSQYNENYLPQIIAALFAILGVIIAGAIKCFVNRQIYFNQVIEKGNTCAVNFCRNEKYC